MAQGHAITGGDAKETGRANVTIVFRVWNVWSAQEGSGDMIVRLSALGRTHAAYEAGVVHLVRASAMPTRPERLVLSAPTAALVPRVNHLATGTARAGGMAGARRRGRASASLAFLDQVFPLFPDLSRVLILPLTVGYINPKRCAIS